MFYLKRIICGLCSLLAISLGGYLLQLDSLLLQISSFCFFAIGLCLLTITIKQSLPTFKFWSYFLIMCLICTFFIIRHNNFKGSEEEKIISEKLDKALNKAKNFDKKEKNAKNIAKQKSDKINNIEQKDNNPLLQYPKISGNINAIHANLFYIGGRYVRLYGIDAPDNDQICSNSFGTAYNCGSEALSWIKGWIDDNKIDCYLVNVNPEGQDKGVCLWGEYDIGAALVKVGWAIANREESNTYIPYEDVAKESMQGMWQGTFYSPKEWRNLKQVKKGFSIKNNSFGFGSWF